MAGLLAVVADDGRTDVSSEELEAFIGHYETLRGAGEVRRYTAPAGWAKAASFDVAEASSTLPADGAWGFAVGTFSAGAPLTRCELGDVDGHFVALRYRPQCGELELFNDPLGMQVVYRASRGERTYFSTSSLVLARHLGAAPDPVGLRLFLRTGAQFGPVSAWEGVERLEPGTVLTFGAGGPREAAYWTPTVDARVRGMGLSETADHIAGVAQDAVRRRIGSESCLWADLTGGYDSRLVTSLLARTGLRFRAQTSGEEETVDVRLARRVAEVGGYDWHQERLPERWSLGPELLDEAVAWADGTLDALALSPVLTLQEERTRSCPVVVNGGGGEHFGPLPWLQEFAQAGRTSKVNLDAFLSMRILAPIDFAPLRPEPVDSVANYCREVLTARARPYARQPNTTQLDALYAYKSVGHFGAYRSAFESRVRTEIPLYYRDVFEAAFSCHHRWRNGHRLHRALIERLGPSVSAVETERGGPAQLTRPGNAHRFAPYYLRLGRTAVRKVMQRPAPSSRPSPVIVGGYRAAVERLRSDGAFDPRTMRTAELFDAAELDALVAGAQAPDFDGWTLLGRIATVELTLRQVDGAGV